MIPGNGEAANHHPRRGESPQHGRQLQAHVTRLVGDGQLRPDFASFAVGSRAEVKLDQARHELARGSERRESISRDSLGGDIGHFYG